MGVVRRQSSSAGGAIMVMGIGHSGLQGVCKSVSMGELVVAESGKGDDDGR